MDSFRFSAGALLIMVFAASCERSPAPVEVIGPMASLSIVSGNEQTGVVGEQLSAAVVVKVTDANGNAVPNQVVNFVVVAGGGTVFAGAAGTNTDGIAQERWTLGTVAGQEQKLEVRAVDATTGEPKVFATFTATATAAAPASIATTTQTSLTVVAGAAVSPSPSVVVRDKYGNVVPGATVTFAINTDGAVAGGSVTGATQTTNAGGIATLGQWTTSSTVGQNKLTAIVTGVPTGVTISASGVPGKYVVTSASASVEAGKSTVVTAQISEPVNGAPVGLAGRVITWSNTADGGTFSSATSTTNASGVAQVTFTTAGTITSSSVSLTATDAHTATGSTTIGVVPAPASKLVFTTQPANGGYLVNLATVRVAIQDASGNLVATSGVPVTLSLGSNPGGATLSGGSATTVNGVATFSNVTLDKAGSAYTLVASADALSATTSTPFDVAAVGVVLSDPSALSTGFGAFPPGIDIVGSTLYFVNRTNGTGLVRLPVTGGSATMLDGPRQTKGGGFLFHDDNNAFYLNLQGNNLCSGFIFRVPLSGTGATAIHSAGGFTGCVLRDMAFDGATFFYSRWWGLGGPNDSGVVRVPAATGVERKLTKLLASTLALDGGLLYFAHDSAIYSMPVDSGAVATVVTGVGSSGTAQELTVVGDKLYWAEGGALRVAPLSGGVATTALTSFTSITRIVRDENTLYIVDSGSLRRVSLPSLTMTTIAANEDVTDVAVDTQSIYWLSNSTVKTIRKTAK